jgi:predicted RNase H-like nuclease (RuvC/YqgF family)
MSKNNEKMMASLTELNAQISEMKEMFSVLEKKAKKLSHAVEMAIKKEKKPEKKERKP